MDQQKQTTRKDRLRSWLTSNPALLAVVVVFFLFSFFINREPSVQTIPYGKFKQLLHTPGVVFRNVRVGLKEIRGEMVIHDHYLAPDHGEKPPELRIRVVPWKTSRIGVDNDRDLYALLAAHAPDYEAEAEESLSSRIMGYLGWLLLMIGSILVFVLIFRKFFGAAGSPFSFGRSKHRRFSDKDEQKITFKDVAGIPEAIEELKEVVEFLRHPEKYQALGGRIPKGVLLVGPPGTGKTLLARAVAGEATAEFFSISGSDFVEMFAGVGASRVRELFRDAETVAPCIIFIDELDALGRSRSGSGFMSHEEREQTLNQLLVEMDGFDTRKGVIIMAATNRPEILDAALLRPGRFDRTVVVDRPDINGREAILKVHTRKITMSADVDLRKIAALTPGSAGADLANLVNEAALLAARKEQQSVAMEHFEEAVERGAVGLQRKSRIMREEEKRRVAYHEAGHALVACAVPNSDPVHKVSIIPRGLAGGYVLQRPDEDRTLMTRGELEARIKVALGGTIAEELVLSDISTGATSDLQIANDLATRMVREFGMSGLGRVYFSADSPLYLPGQGGESTRTFSEQTSREIDMEVRNIINRCLDEVKHILERERPALEEVAALLVEKEVIDEKELEEILKRHGLNSSASRF